jgi:hypothetical protein
MLTWMCRPTSVIEGKADIARTRQYDPKRIKSALEASRSIAQGSGRVSVATNAAAAPTDTYQKNEI